MPPLSPRQLQLFHEDVFETFLVASQVEYNYGEATNDPEAKREAARRSIPWLDRAEKLLPPTRVLYVRRQFYKQQIGDLEGAEADRKRGESIVPNSPVNHFWRGIADRYRADQAVKNKQITAARQSYDRARIEFAKLLQARPEHFWGYLEWAGCLNRLGNPYDAIVGYTACIQLRPDAPWPYHDRANCHADLKEYEDAIADESAALERDSDYSLALISRAKYYQILGQNALALADFDHAIRLEPSRGDALFDRARIHFRAKDYRKALDDYNAVVSLLPDRAGPYKSRAKTHYELKDFEASLADWSTAASLLPKDAESRYWIGVLNMGLRRDDPALRASTIASRLTLNMLSLSWPGPRSETGGATRRRP